MSDDHEKKDTENQPSSRPSKTKNADQEKTRKVSKSTETEAKTAYGKALKFFRGRFQLSRDDLSEITGISKNTIANIENGITQEPRAQTIYDIICGLYDAGHPITTADFESKAKEFRELSAIEYDTSESGSVSTNEQEKEDAFRKSEISEIWQKAFLSKNVSQLTNAKLEIEHFISVKGSCPNSQRTLLEIEKKIINEKEQKLNYYRFLLEPILVILHIPVIILEILGEILTALHKVFYEKKRSWFTGIVMFITGLAISYGETLHKLLIIFDIDFLWKLLFY